jgi:arsenate reductase
MAVVDASRAPKTVLFVCDRNACRSQVAAAVFNRFADARVVHAVSAGTRPARRVHPQLLEAMREIGIELRHPTPQLASPDSMARVEIINTLGCGDSCPSPRSVPHDDWMLTDPEESSLEALRSLRDEIVAHVRKLVAAQPWLEASRAG